MSDEKIQYDVHDYTPVNRYIDDQARLKRSASTWRYAKAAALILVAVGILTVLLAWAYYLYKKPHRLVSLSDIEQKVLINEERLIKNERRLPSEEEINTSTTSNILQSTLASHLGTQAAQASIKELVTLLSSSTISTNIVHSSLSNAGRSGTVVSRKRLGEHQQWRMEMLMKLIFRENGSENKKCKKSKSQYKKRLDIMHKILLKHLPIEALNGWSLWSNANGAFLNASDDWTSSSSDDGNSSETNDEISVSIDRATTYAGSEISSSFSSSSSSYALSLVSSNPSYSFSKYDVNVWGF